MPRPSNLSEEVRDQIVEMRLNGTSAIEIANQLQIPRTVIYYWLNKAGIGKARTNVVPPPDPNDAAPFTPIETGDKYLDRLMARILEQEREIGRLQGLLQTASGSRSASPPEPKNP